jgi:hypothetical protein
VQVANDTAREKRCAAALPTGRQVKITKVVQIVAAMTT